MKIPVLIGTLKPFIMDEKLMALLKPMEYDSLFFKFLSLSFSLTLFFVSLFTEKSTQNADVI